MQSIDQESLLIDMHSLRGEVRRLRAVVRASGFIAVLLAAAAWICRGSLIPSELEVASLRVKNSAGATVVSLDAQFEGWGSVQIGDASGTARVFLEANARTGSEISIADDLHRPKAVISAGRPGLERGITGSPRIELYNSEAAQVLWVGWDEAGIGELRTRMLK